MSGSTKVSGLRSATIISLVRQNHWFGQVCWFGQVWTSSVRFGQVRSGLVKFNGSVRFDASLMVLSVSVRFGQVQSGSVRFDGSVRFVGFVRFIGSVMFVGLVMFVG